MSAPTKLNTGNNRPVTSVLVKSADNASTEREQLNRILKMLSETAGGTQGETGASGSTGSSGRAGATGAAGSDATGVGMALLLGGM